MNKINLLAIATVAALATDLTAQCSTFANNPPGSNLNLFDDSQAVMALPFTFTFNNVAYTTITVSSNGFVAFGTQTGQTSYMPSASAALSGVPRVMPLWWDLNPGSGGGVYYQPTTTQVSVVWKGVPEYPASTTSIGNFEVILQSNGQITFYYDATNALVSTRGILPSQLVGITAGGGAAANARNWNVDAAGSGITLAAATGTEEFTDATATPPSPFDLSNLSGSGTTIAFLPLDPQHTSYQALVLGANLPTCPTGPIIPPAGPVTSFGTGCPSLAGDNAIYEMFTDNAGSRPFDLSNTSITFIKSGTDYITIPGPGFDSNYTGGTILGMGDDTYLSQSLGNMGSFQLGTNAAVSNVVVASNGYIAVPSVAFDSYVTDVNDFHTGGARIAALWEDLYCNTTTQLCYWENNNPAFCRATWVNVPEYFSSGSNTFQITLLANGDITISYLNCTAGIAHTPLVGIVGRATAVDLGAVDLVTSGTVNINTRTLTSGVSITPMTQSASGPAQLGLPFSLTSTVPANNLGIGAWLIGVTNPNIPLSSVFPGLALPNCSLYSGAEIQQTLPYFFTPGSSTFTLSFPVVPYNPAFGGMVVYTQALAALPPFLTQVASSDGLTFSVGL